MTYFPQVKIDDSSWNIINPAKEDGNLATIAGTDFSTSAKQDTIIGHIDGLETGLTNIDTTLTDDSQTSQFVDPNGARLYLESNGWVPVNIQDQSSEMVSLYMREVINTITLASNITLWAYTCTLTAGHGVVVGNYIVFKEGDRFFQAEVIIVATNTITVDSPFDYAFTTAAVGQRCNINMTVDWSSTPRVFYVSPANLTNFKFHITHISLVIRSGNDMDTSKFGSLTKLTKGCVLWTKDWAYKKLFNFKTNGDIGLYTSDLQFDPKAPSWEYGLQATKYFTGQDKMGVTLMLDSATSDELQMIIQDNLTGLTRFVVLVEWHRVVN